MVMAALALNAWSTAIAAYISPVMMTSEELMLVEGAEAPD